MHKIHTIYVVKFTNYLINNKLQNNPFFLTFIHYIYLTSQTLLKYMLIGKQKYIPIFWENICEGMEWRLHSSCAKRHRGAATCPLSSAKAISGTLLLKKHYRLNLSFKIGFLIIERQNSISKSFYRLNLL